MKFLSGLKHYKTLLPQLFVVIAAFLIMVLLGSFFGSVIVNKYVSRYGDEIISVSAETIKTYLQGYEITIIDIAFFLERQWGQNSGGAETAAAMQEELILWSKWLQAHDEKFTEIISIYGTINGKYITTSAWTFPDDYKPETRVWYTGAQAAGGKVFCSDPYTDARTGENVVSFSKLLFDENNRPFGVIALDVFISIISDYVACIKLMDSGYGILLDSNRRVIVHPITDFFGMSLEGITGATRKAPNNQDGITSATRSASNNQDSITSATSAAGKLTETRRAADTNIFSGYAEMIEHLKSAEGVSAYDYITASGDKIVIFMRELFIWMVFGVRAAK
ncbi:MAG: cache domain-containing protein [Treponema sp.]|nr:cache domain-containing protein [Treponema sp.]